MNLLFIDTRIPDIENIRNSVTENTHCILFDYTTDTLVTIKNQIQCTYVNVGIIQHNYDASTFQLLKSSPQSTLSNVSTIDPTLTTWREYIEFFEWFTANGTQHIDLFACNVWADTNWRYVIETIRNIYAVHIRASINITGEGGDFVLESDNVDTIGIYFLQEILDYKYAFYYAPVGSSDPNYLYAKNYEFSFPSTNLGTFDSSNSNYSNTFGTYGSAPRINKSGIKQVVTNSNGCSAILFNDGTVFTYGTTPSDSRNWGADSSSVSLQLYNITKIVACDYGFTALRSDGRVITWGQYDINILIYNNNSELGYIPFNLIQSNIDTYTIVDIYSSNTCYFAKDNNGKIFIWGQIAGLYAVNDQNIFTLNGTELGAGGVNVASYISSGVLSVFTNRTSVCFMKQTSALIISVLNNSSIVPIITLYSAPQGHIIKDILPIPTEYLDTRSYGIYQRAFIPITEYGTELYLRDYLLDGSSVKLCNNDISIVKKGMTNAITTYKDEYGNLQYKTTNVLACLLSNNEFVTVDYSALDNNGGYLLRPIKVSRLANVTDFTIDGVIIQNGNIINTLTTPATTIYNSGNAVRLFYTRTTKGALFSDGSFNYWGGTIPNFTLTTPLQSQMASGVKNVYDTADGYMLIKDTSFVWIGSSTTKIFGFGNYDKIAGSSPNIGTLPTNKNLFLLSTSINVMPIELERNTTGLSPLTVTNNNILQINNGDPNRMAHYGRTYTLYDITNPSTPTVISTFTASYETMTFTFTNIPTTFYGEYTLSIVDTTNTPATMTVVDAFYSNITNPNAIAYSYSYTPTHLIRNQTFDFTLYSYYTLSVGTYYLKDASSQILSTVTFNTEGNTIIFSNINTSLLTLGMNQLYIYRNSIQLNRFPMLINATCFLEGTKILTMDIRRNKTRYIPIEKLKPGMLVKTLSSGFIPIKHIGYSTIYNPGLSTCVKDQLFKYTKSSYPELTNDLVLTGTHSILVKTITETQRKDIIDTLGGICVTENRYRLPAFNDTRAVRYEHQGKFRIWNLALENESYHGNYGIYANGLLVETTSCRYITELSGMTLVE